MKKVIKLKHLVVIFGLLVVPGAASAASLLEVYQQALQSDPLIHEAEATRRPPAAGEFHR